MGKIFKGIIISFLPFTCLLLFPLSASALSLSVTVPEKYTTVSPGDRFYFVVDVKYPENPGRKDLRFTYEIKRENSTIVEVKSLKAIETQASFMDFIVIPEDAKKGNYIVDVRIEDYNSLFEEVSSSFIVKAKLDSKQILFYSFAFLQSILFGAVLIAAFIFLFNKSRK